MSTPPLEAELVLYLRLCTHDLNEMPIPALSIVTYSIGNKVGHIICLLELNGDKLSAQI